MARRGSPFPDDERSDARERAMLLFYEADTKQVPVAEIVVAQVLPIDSLTQLLVDGTAEHRDEVDAVIAANARGWTLKRMPAIDLTVLRIASFELFHRPDVSTADSGRFVNGVLASVAKIARPPG